MSKIWAGRADVQGDSFNPELPCEPWAAVLGRCFGRPTALAA